MGRPSETQLSSEPILAGDLARARASQIVLRLRVGMFPDTIDGEGSFPSWLHRKVEAVRAPLGSGGDPHERLAAVLSLAAEAQPLIAAVDGGGRWSVSHYLARTIEEFKTDGQRVAKATQRGSKQ
jgi:hypothetical protein